MHGAGKSESVTLNASVESAAAQSEQLRRMADVSVKAGESLSYQNTLNFLQTQILQTRRAGALVPKSEVFDADARTLRHQDRPFDDVTELADVSGPGMPKQRVKR
jgi:hypothetical protein